ncbi:MAG TPA: phosphatidylserine/phosphatidylglycerophosphate/cardiolipin synthase family protein [Bacteroidales bacterium]|nr:phosphatidylserine/phosphatidylglycerophosphate/cardiolipin synthase family protein [Bacteroidales bacterium]HSA43024.1 phosphatidylserine/phosphatidylglycerophosphate/cardiolipin synthase family protein [Bacteroidales bacterium]
MMDNKEFPEYFLFDDPMAFYPAMLKDIEKARTYIYLETYRFGNDSIGRKFRDALTKKAYEGVEVRLLVDSWGSQVTAGFFADFLRVGGDVRFFRKIVFSFDFFTKNHRRNHRKLLIIDDRIVYMGSANITGYSLNWREMVIRLTGGITLPFKKTFLDSWKIYNKYIFNKLSYKKTIYYRGFEIIQDIPSIYRQMIKKKYEVLIRGAAREVIIETPYFVPGYIIRKELMEAARRGVSVKVIVPMHSDVTTVDLLRSKYLGPLHKAGVRIFFYTLDNLHAKCMTVDDEVFSIGSSNVDYRSFRYMYEIALFGGDSEIIGQMNVHLAKTLENCVAFSYEKWLHRPRIEKFFAFLLVPFRHLF